MPPLNAPTRIVCGRFTPGTNKPISTMAEYRSGGRKKIPSVTGMSRLVIASSDTPRFLA
jgi:hypothetical protein